MGATAMKFQKDLLMSEIWNYRPKTFDNVLKGLTDCTIVKRRRRAHSQRSASRRATKIAQW